MSKIEWTDRTWNCVTGCDKVSLGCNNCYAETMTNRLRAMGMKKYAAGFKHVLMHRDLLKVPKEWTKPCYVFVNSMSDTFHFRVRVDFIKELFAVMAECPEYTFQLLTKRSARLLLLNNSLTWPENVWMGVTVEHSEYKYRIDSLRATDAQIKFLSMEPLLSPMPNLNLNGIHWVIVGGETGAGARHMDPDWARDIRDQCDKANISLFVKQMSKKAPIPEDLNIRQFPKGRYEL